MDGIRTSEGDVNAGHYHHNYGSFDKFYADKHHDHDEYLEHHHLEDYAKKDDVPTKGVAGAGLGLGIAGTALGIWNAWREREDRDRGYRGGRGGYDGGYGYPVYGGGCGHGDREERHYEIRQSERISGLEAMLAQQSAERFTEQKVFATYRDLDGKIERLAAKSGETDCRLAVMEATTAAKLEGLRESLIETRVSLKSEFKLAIELEAERRECCCEKDRMALHYEKERREDADRRLHDWTECNFVRNRKVIPAHDICPPVMPRFNSFDVSKVDPNEAPPTPTP